MRGDVTPPPLRTCTAEASPPPAQGRRWQVLFNTRPRYNLSGAIVNAQSNAPPSDSDLAGTGGGGSRVQVIFPQPRARPLAKRMRSASQGDEALRKWRATALMSMVRTNVIKAGSVICIRAPKEQLRASRAPARLCTVYEGFITSKGLIQRRDETYVTLSDFASAAHGEAHGPNPYGDGWFVTYVKRKSCTLVDVIDISGMLVTNPGAFVSVSDVDRARGALAQTLASPEAAVARARSNSRVRQHAPDSAAAPGARGESAGEFRVRAARETERRRGAARRRAAKRSATAYPKSMPTSVHNLSAYGGGMVWSGEKSNRSGPSPVQMSDAMMLQRAMGARVSPLPLPAAALCAGLGAPSGHAAIASAAAISTLPAPPHARHHAAWDSSTALQNRLSPESLRSVLTTMLEAFYRCVNPQKVAQAGEIAKYYASNLAGLNSQLMSAYGRDLKSVVPEDAAGFAVEGGAAALPATRPLTSN